MHDFIPFCLQLFSWTLLNKKKTPSFRMSYKHRVNISLEIIFTFYIRFKDTFH